MGIVAFITFNFLVIFSSISYMVSTEYSSGSFELEEIQSNELQGQGESFYWLRVSPVHGEKEQTWDLSELFSSQHIQLESTSKIITIFRWKIWWMIPKTIDMIHEVPPETYFILAKGTQEGQFISIITTKGFSLEGSSSSLALHYHMRESASLSSQRAALLSFGGDPLHLAEKGVMTIKRHIRENAGHQTSSSELPVQSAHRSFVDFFGWCTWDSFYTDLSESKIVDGLASFSKTAVRPRFIILDDGWQRTDVDHVHNGKQWGGRLSSFHANFKFSDEYGNSAIIDEHAVVTEDIIKEALPYVSNGDSHDGDDFSLRDVVAKAKTNYSIETFIVWHTLTGYWGGISLKSTSTLKHLRPELKFPHLTASVMRMSVAQALQKEPFSTQGVGLVHIDHAQEFFQQYHQTLREMGVDGVKVDAQSVLPLLEDSRAAGKDMALEFHKGLRSSVLTNFGSTSSKEVPVIHCMAHSQDTLLSIAALYGDDDVPVIRGSDDFWPTDPSSHGPHIYANAMNSLLMSHIGVHDWDMWQSALGAPSAMHAASRAISGGPVYVSDRPYSQNEVLLRQVSMPDGSIPRPIRNCRPAASTLFLDPQRTAGVPLVLQNANPSGGFVMGAFNIVGSVLENDKDLFRELTDDEMVWPAKSVANGEKQREKDLQINWTIGLHDVEEWKRGGNTSAEYVAFRFSDNMIFLLSEEKGTDVPISLPKVFDSEIITFAPLLSSSIENKLKYPLAPWAAFLGATEMLNPGGAVLSIAKIDSDDGTSCSEEELRLSVELLGEGLYQMVVCSECTAQVLHAEVLSGESDISDVTLESNRTMASVGTNSEKESKTDVNIISIQYMCSKKRKNKEGPGVDIRQRVALKIRVFMR